MTTGCVQRPLQGSRFCGNHKTCARKDEKGNLIDFFNKKRMITFFQYHTIHSNLAIEMNKGVTAIYAIEIHIELRIKKEMRRK